MLDFDICGVGYQSVGRNRRVALTNRRDLAPTKVILCMQGFFDMPKNILILPRPQIKQNEKMMMI